MRISEVYIKGLYGVYTYKIANLLSQNLLVLTGYNGMGKTTILNIVKKEESALPMLWIIRHRQ